MIKRKLVIKKEWTTITEYRVRERSISQNSSAYIDRVIYLNLDQVISVKFVIFLSPNLHIITQNSFVPTFLINYVMFNLLLKFNSLLCLYSLFLFLCACS